MMNFDLNVASWNWNQWKAAGKHAASYVAGGVSVAVALHFITPQDASQITDNLDDIYHGAEQFAKGVAGLIGVLTPIYAGFKAAYNASTPSQVSAVKAAEPKALVEAVQTVSPVTLRDAVAAQPEVKAIVVDTPAAAAASPSPKVTI